MLDEVEAADEEDEVLEASVEVVLCAETHDVLEVRVVDVRVHSEQPLEDHLDYAHEVFGEGHAQNLREDLLVAQLILHPRHQEINVLAR